MDQDEKEMNKKEQNMNKIQDAVHRMQEAFKRSNVPLYIATPMQYDSETQFNVKNASQYLGEIEEYISVLITQLAY
jgi:hypothetical protein